RGLTNGTGLGPPARTLASLPYRARAASADARSVARSYSNRAGFMPPTSPSSRRATDGLSFFWNDLSRHYPGDQGDREFLRRFTVPSDTSSLNLSDCQRRRVAARARRRHA